MTKRVKDEALKGVAGGGTPITEFEAQRLERFARQGQSDDGKGGGVSNTGLVTDSGSSGPISEFGA